MNTSSLLSLQSMRMALAAVLLIFQYWILFEPNLPLVERSAHLVLTLALVFILKPRFSQNEGGRAFNLLSIVMLSGVVFIGYYYFSQMERLTTRIENVSPIEHIDLVAAATLIVLLVLAVKRTVGFILTGVVVAFLLYGLFGYLLPGGMGFSRIYLDEWAEIFAMTTSGVLGVTTATSTNFIFYFIVFGVVYSSVGGGQLFIELAMRMVGTSRGGGAKVAIIGSSLMGTISGSAVANVTATGVFTIPLMKRTGIEGEKAAAFEAIASTGGQLMPPIMGIAAFVMAEMLAVPYAQVALAGIFPALAFYFSIFLYADLMARKTGAGTLKKEDFKNVGKVLPRINMLLPPVVLVAGLASGYSAQIAVMWATISCFVCPLLSKHTRYSLKLLPQMIVDSGIQAAKIAAPIMAIGVVIAVAIQSNLALKFASGLISFGDGSYGVALLLVVIGCIIMGMGLPTVAAYIIGAVLYVPALTQLGISELQAHFFVMYFCVLSMVTPPVSLASFAAAGVAGTDSMRTSVVAFKVCAVAFLIPFAFITDPALLFTGDGLSIAIAGAGLIASTIMWAIGVVGFAKRSMHLVERIGMMACGGMAMLTTTGSALWLMSISIALCYLLYHFISSSSSTEKPPIGA